MAQQRKDSLYEESKLLDGGNSVDRETPPIMTPSQEVTMTQPEKYKVQPLCMFYNSDKGQFQGEVDPAQLNEIIEFYS